MTVSTADNAILDNFGAGSNDNQAPVLRYPVICIDGPSGAGKGTVTWRLAQADRKSVV